MPRPIPLPEALGAHFSVATAREFDIGRGRIRGGQLSKPFYGVRSREEPQTVAERTAAFAHRLPDRGFYSHTTAAALWGLPLPGNVDPRLHVSYPNGCRAPRTVGVIGHHLVMRPDEIVELDGLRLTSPARTWCDLAGVIGFESLIAAADRAVWHRDPLTSIEELADMAQRHPGRRGRPIRLAALPWISDRSESRPETILRVRFVRAGLPHPAINVDVFDVAGVFVGRPDIAFPDYRESIEYEGDGHRTSRKQWYRDLERVPRFEAVGWHVTRAASPDLDARSIPLILRVAHQLRTKGWHGEIHI